MHPLDIRDEPSAEFIASLRERYRVEPEIDRMLTRKMQRRPGTPYAMVSLDFLSQCLSAMLSNLLTGEFTVSNCRWLAGGASKIQMRFSLSWISDGIKTDSDLVVRMEPTESLNASSRLREFQLLKALGGAFPVPKVYWVDADGTWFPEPALIYAFAPGVSKPTRTVNSGVTGLGSQYGPQLRQLLAPQFVNWLAKIHTFDHSGADLSSFERPAVGTTDAAMMQIQNTARVWEEDRGAELALMDVAADWLSRNMPSLDRASIVHGDYRGGNFLFDEDSGQFTAILDWERAFIGDRHRDLAWCTTNVLGHLDEDGKTFLMCGLLPEQAFYEAYEKASGLTVDRTRVHFYQVLNRYQQLQIVLGTAYRVVHLGKSHQNIVISRLQKASWLLAEDLRRSLEEVI